MAADYYAYMDLSIDSRVHSPNYIAMTDVSGQPGVLTQVPAQVLKAFYRTSLGTWTAQPADPAEVAA